MIISAEVTYTSCLTFFSAPFISSDAWISLRDDGKLFIFDMRHLLAGEEAVVMRVTARPVKLTGGPALDAVPTAVDQGIQELFAVDELITKSAQPTRWLQARIEHWVSEAEQIGGGSRPLFIGRNDCEIADQWLYARLPSLVAAAREQLLFAGPSELAAGASRPLASFQAEYFRPLFLGDEARIELGAHARGEQTLFVYRVLGAPVPGDTKNERPLCAMAMEVF